MRKIFIFVLCFMCFAFGCSRRPSIIAHRGNSSCAPENSLAAINSAWQVGTDAVEIDVHLTKDEKIVVMHDFNTKRTSGKDLIIADTSYTDLANLDIGSWKNSSFKDERIPLLEQVIATVPKDKRLFIEIKCGSSIIPYLKELIEHSARRSSVVIISFNLEVLKDAKAQMPEIPMYLLASSPRQDQTGEFIPYGTDLIETAVANNLDGLDLHYCSLTRDFVTKTHNAGLKLYAWTIDNPKDIRRLAEFKVDGVTSNVPAAAKSYFYAGDSKADIAQ